MNGEIGLFNIIKKISFFSVIPDAELQKLILEFKKVNLYSGDVLFSQGDSSDFAYILIAGKLISLLSNEVNESPVIGAINPVETVGELGALSNEPRSLTVKAVAHSVLLAIPSVIFKELCRQYPDMLAEVSRLIIQRSLKTIQFMENKEKANISMIFPMLEFDFCERIICSLKESSQMHNFDIIIYNDYHDDLNRAILQAESKGRDLIVFMKNKNFEILKLYGEKLTSVYFMVEPKAFNIFSSEMRQAVSLIKYMPNKYAHLILLHPLTTKQPEGTLQYLKQIEFKSHYHIQVENKADWDRLMRVITKKSFALVLGGGGLRGYAHVGVLQALEEKNIAVDAIGGTSAGSVIAALYCMYRNYKVVHEHLDKLQKLIKKTLRLWNIVWPIISVYSSRITQNFAKDVFKKIRIEDLWIPYYAVSVNFNDKCSMVHETGLVSEAIIASASIPGLFSPFVKDGKIFYDGGVLNNLPVIIMRDRIGYGHKIMASKISRHEPKKAYYQFPSDMDFKQSLLVRLKMMAHQYSIPPFLETFLETLFLGSYERDRINSLAADYLVAPDLSDFRMLSLRKGDDMRLIDLGYKSTLIELEKKWFDVGQKSDN